MHERIRTQARIGVLVLLGLAAVGAAAFFVLQPRTASVLIPAPTTIASVTPSVSASSVPTVSPTSSPSVTNPLTGEACANALRRPIAVMLSGDAVARPLSGIAEADMVFEMPVITGSITRFMAVYGCRDPIEIGSVRSARHDFIALARGLDAIYAHWGGSHFALDLLKKRTMDNVDALPNPTHAFWRKDSAPAPHNGFTSLTRLLNASRFLQYRLESKAPAYLHVAESSATTTRATLEVGYAGPFRVRYVYDADARAFARIRGGATERDYNTGAPVLVRNVVVMRAESKQIEDQYNDVQVEGTGDAAIYAGPKEVLGTWSKDKKDATAKLTFRDRAGEEIPFLTGNVWVEIVEPYTDVRWEAE